MYFIFQGEKNNRIPEIVPQFARKKILTRGHSGGLQHIRENG